MQDHFLICQAKDLSPDQKVVIEAILGRTILEEEQITVRATLPAPLADERRAEALRGLETYFALRSTRPQYRSVR